MDASAIHPTKTRYAYPSYVVVALAIVLGLSYMDRLVFSVLVEQIKQELRLTDGQIGFVGGIAFAVFYAIFGLPLARWIDKHSRVAMLTAGILMWSLATAACGLSQNFAQLFVARTGTGAGEGVAVPAGHSLIAAYIPREFRALAVGVFHAGASFGVICGMILGGLLAARYGWRTAFLLVGAPGVGAALIFALTVREPARSEIYQPGLDWRTTLATLFANRAFVHIALAFAVLNFSVFALMFWLPSFYQRIYGLSVAQVGFAVGLTNGLGSAIGIGLGGLAAPSLLRRDRRWACWYPALGMATCVPLFLATLIAPTPEVSLALLFLASTVAQLGNATGLAAVHTVSSPRDRGQAVAVVVLLSALIGQGAGPSIVGVISDLAGAKHSMGGLQVGLLVSIAGFAWAVVHFLLASRTIVHDAVD